MHSYTAFLIEIRNKLKKYLKEMDILGINCLQKTFPGTKLKVKFQLWLLRGKYNYSWDYDFSGTDFWALILKCGCSGSKDKDGNVYISTTRQARRWESIGTWSWENCLSMLSLCRGQAKMKLKSCLNIHPYLSDDRRGSSA